MKALFIKDIKLLKSQRQFFGAILLMLIIFTVVQDNFSFAISYVTLMFGILTITTMGYDDLENGMCYLLTMPVSRKKYVREKFLFGIGTSLCGLISSSVFALAVTTIKGGSFQWEEWVATASACVLIITVTLAVTTPLQLKFGSEKSRMAFLAVYGVGFLGVFAVMKFCKAAGIDIAQVLESAFVEKIAGTVWGIGLVSAALLLVSYLISARILEKREF